MQRDDRIHVVFSTEMGIGGTELNAVRTAERLDVNRFRLSVVCRSEGALSQRYERAGIPVRVFPIPNLYGPTSVRRGLQLARFLGTEGVSIFHSHDVYGNIFGTFYAKVARVPVTIASRRWWDYVPRPALGRLNAYASRHATCVLANSPAIADLVCDREGVARGRVAVVPNFLDEEAFAPLPVERHQEELATLGVPPGSLVVGCVANLSRVKNHAMLLSAAALVGQRHPDVYYVLYGDGPCRPELEAQARALGIDKRVIFAGLTVREWNLHRLFDVSVLCSDSEGFPNSIIEAMAAGRAVVATRVGGNVDAVDDGRTGLLVPPGDERLLAEALATLLEDAERREAMGERGAAAARTEYLTDRVIPRLEGLYTHLVDHGQLAV